MSNERPITNLKIIGPATVSFTNEDYLFESTEDCRFKPMTPQPVAHAKLDNARRWQDRLTWFILGELSMVAIWFIWG